MGVGRSGRVILALGISSGEDLSFPAMVANAYLQQHAAVSQTAGSTTDLEPDSKPLSLIFLTCEMGTIAVRIP